MIVFKLLYKLFLGIIYCSVFAYHFILTIFKNTPKKPGEENISKAICENQQSTTI